MDIIVEPAAPHDVAFVCDSWLRSFRRSPSTAGMSVSVYWDRFAPQVRELVASGSVLVARPEDWDRGIIGWVSYEKAPHTFVLHYVYVKNVYRRMGVMAKLLSAAGDSDHQHRVITRLRPPYSDILLARGYKHER